MTEESLEEAARQIPNMIHPDVPLGKLDTENLEVKKVGVPRKFDFEPMDHVRLGEELELFDFDRGTKVSGPKFYYLKNEAVFLEQALIQYALNTLRRHGFEIFITPDVAREEVLRGIGFNPRGNESNVYSIEDEGTCLVATAEITLGGYHSGEILEKEKLPLLYGGLSHCFRREAGAAGQFSKGLYRVHQFDKVEIVRIDTPEHSYQSWQEMLDHVEGLLKKLELPYHLLLLCGGDMSFTSSICVDFETYSAAQHRWLEVSSVSNFESYQANRLHCRYRHAEDKKIELCHTLNGSALALPRIVATILENNQTPQGIRVPRVLVPYCGFEYLDDKND